MNASDGAAALVFAWLRIVTVQLEPVLVGCPWSRYAGGIYANICTRYSRRFAFPSHRRLSLGPGGVRIEPGYHEPGYHHGYYYGRSGRSAYGGQCRELRQACPHKEELGDEGLGNCQRYRQGLLSPCNPTFPRGIARCPLSLMTSPSPGLVPS